MGISGLRARVTLSWPPLLFLSQCSPHWLGDIVVSFEDRIPSPTLDSKVQEGVFLVCPEHSACRQHSVWAVPEAQ